MLAVARLYFQGEKHLPHATVGRRSTLNANNLVLYDAAQAFQFNLEGRSNHLVRIPRHMLNSRITDIESLMLSNLVLMRMKL